MKAFLMYRDRDLDLERDRPANEDELVQDLGLVELFGAMAHGDEFLFDVAKGAVLSSLDDADGIRYRQDILNDCLQQPATVRQIYDIAVAAITGQKKIYRSVLSKNPDAILHSSIDALQLFVDVLRDLRQTAQEHVAAFRSDGFTRFFQMLISELGAEYFDEVEGHLKQLRFRRGVLISAELGQGNTGTDYTLRRAIDTRPEWVQRISFADRSGLSFRISDRDESGAQALAGLRGRGINLVANALAQSTDHILSFFRLLRAELGFYLGCVNLRDRLGETAGPFCFPAPLPPGKPAFTCHGIYDVCLALRSSETVVGNDVEADGKSLIMITGANQGGKSTFLRSVGLSQLMMQAGMFVPAESFAANVCTGVFTHYKREEDAEMNSGKLDEELSRMSRIVDDVTPGSVVLFNESFAATNEREGSEIARQIIRALVESGVKICFVTHMFDLAHEIYASDHGHSLFLRAQRQADGQRTYRLVEGEPLPTSYGEDLYARVFGAAAEPEHGAASSRALQASRSVDG